MKEDYEAELDSNEMTMLRWMYGFHLKDNKKNMKVKELLGLDPVILTIKRGRLQ